MFNHLNTPSTKSQGVLPLIAAHSICAHPHHQPFHRNLPRRHPSTLSIVCGAPSPPSTPASSKATSVTSSNSLLRVKYFKVTSITLYRSCFAISSPTCGVLSPLSPHLTLMRFSLPSQLSLFVNNCEPDRLWAEEPDYIWEEEVKDRGANVLCP